MNVRGGETIRLTESLRVRCCYTVFKRGSLIKVIGRNKWVPDQPRKRLRTAVIRGERPDLPDGWGGYHVTRTGWIQGERV